MNDVIRITQSPRRDHDGVRVGYVFTPEANANAFVVWSSDQHGAEELSHCLQWAGASETTRHPADWPTHSPWSAL